MAGMAFNAQNVRLLYRAMLWTAGKENALYRGFSSNIHTECHYYPDKNIYAIVNNDSDKQITDFYDINGSCKQVELQPYEIVWIKAE